MLNTTEWGDPSGAPVVCLHGVTGHGGRFRALAERLPDHRVVAVDLRGHGRSTWEPPWGIEQHLADLLEAADALGIERAVWVGHSFGGRLVCELARRNAQRVERAVLLDPAMHIDPAVASERTELLFDDVSFGSADEAVDARLADGSLYSTPREVLEGEADDHLVKGDDGRHRWRYSRAAVLVAWSEMAAPAPPFPDRPVLVVLGKRSWIPVDVPAAANVVSVSVPGGHSVLWDDLEATAGAVARFLA
jgi:lipase